MAVTGATRLLLALVAGLFAHVANAGSALNVVLSVEYGSGPCGAAVTRQTVSVYCGPAPVLPPVAVGAGLNQQVVPGRSFTNSAPPFLGFSSANASATAAPLVPSLLDRQEDRSENLPWPAGDPAFRQVGVLPADLTGHTALALYSGGPNVSGWRMVSNDNAEHVELTISW